MGGGESSGRVPAPHRASRPGTGFAIAQRHFGAALHSPLLDARPVPGAETLSMAAYVLRRLWQMVPTLAGVVLLVFLLFHYFGSDPSIILAGQNATQAQIAAIRQQLGLDQPAYVQFWIYLKSIVSFDWGRRDRKSTRLNSSHIPLSRMPSSA